MKCKMNFPNLESGYFFTNVAMIESFKPIMDFEFVITANDEKLIKSMNSERFNFNEAME